MTASVDCRGTTAVITGAASGLGKALAVAAAARGMNVVLADRAEDRLYAALGELEASGANALPAVTDVGDAEAVERLAEQAIARFGPISLLVNNAGIETIGLSWELPASAWERAVSVNLLGVVYCANAFARRMVAADIPARIVNVSSVAALGAMPLTAPYMATKHAVLSFSESLRMEVVLQDAPIAVSVVLPASVATSIFTDAAGDEAAPRVAAHRRRMNDMLAQQGLSPDNAARIIFDQIDQDRFWISTDPDLMRMMAKARGEHIAALAEPVLTDQLRSLLGE